MEDTGHRPFHKKQPPSAVPSFGEYLRRERELREITLREISDHTKISYRYLEALEGDNPSKLPAEVFVKGFIRSYARYIGLDTDEAILRFQEFEKTKEIIGDPQKSPGSTDISVPGKPKDHRWLWIVAALLVTGTALFFGYGAWQGRSESRPVETVSPDDSDRSLPAVPEAVEETVSEETEPFPAAAPDAASETERPSEREPEASPPSPLEITLHAQEQTWLSVDVDSRHNYDITLQPGEEIHFSMDDSMRLTIGNAGGLLIRTDGRTLGPLGESGRVIKNFLLTRKDLEGGPSREPNQQ